MRIVIRAPIGQNQCAQSELFDCQQAYTRQYAHINCKNYIILIKMMVLAFAIAGRCSVVDQPGVRIKQRLLSNPTEMALL